jgi:hypothetical protein
MSYKDPQKRKEYKREWTKSKALKNSSPLNFPPIKIPDNMKQTQYTGYYITEDG